MNRDRGDSTDTMNALHMLSLSILSLWCWLSMRAHLCVCYCHVFSYSFTIVGSPGPVSAAEDKVSGPGPTM